MEVLGVTLMDRLTISTKGKPASTVTDTSMIRPATHQLTAAKCQATATFPRHGAAATLDR